MSAPERLAITQALQRAQSAWSAGDLAAVERLCRGVLQARPDTFDALQLLGLLALRLGRAGDAVPLLAHAASVEPGSVEARYNLALALHAARRLQESLAVYGEVLTMRPGFADAYTNRGVVRRDLGDELGALADYDRALALDPASARAHNNRGVALRALRRHEEALASYECALAAQADFAEAHCNLGAVLADLGRHGEALASQERALAIAPGHVDAWVRRAVALTDLGEHAAAVASFRRALEIAPERDWLEGTWLHARMRIADWEEFDAALDHLARRVAGGERATLPLAWLALVDDPASHRKAAETWARAQAPPPLAPAPRRRQRASRLHVGYFSADFHEHATAYLVAGVLERHDRAAFEVTAFSFGPRTRDAMQQRIEGAVERFVDVRDRSDDEVARLARELGVDIAVDLKGYTDHARIGIFARRVAPMQVSYLGYPGTLGAPFMDAILADRTVLPEAARGDYAERAIYLPGCYQANDAGRAPAAASPSRSEAGLPEDGFVFCCFNSAHKILPATFDAWMRLLRSVPNSVLWLLADHAVAQRNLRAAATARGVDAQRLVFAERLRQAEHMARVGLADVFLDTFPYNAHTTASDALWAGVPVVTRIGASFAARVAASLLQAVALDDLVATTLAEYEGLALGLATDPARLRAVRERLAANRGALFDPARHARELEAAYRDIATSS